MRQFLAILADSLRESIDRRSLLVLLLLSLLPILFCFSLRFETRSPEEVLQSQVDGFGTFTLRNRGSHITSRTDVAVEIGDIVTIEDNARGAELRGGYATEITFADPAALDSVAIGWFRFYDHADFDGLEDADVPEVVDGLPRAQAYLTRHFELAGFEHVAVEKRAAGSYSVAVRAEYPDEISGALRVSVGFGAWSMPIPELSLAEFVVLLQQILAGAFVGFVGMLVAVSACSSFVPNMLQKGTLDLVLARPIGRGKLLLAKYVGGLWFVATLATFMVGGCWLGLTVGSGYSNPWFLLAIPTLLVAFAVVYSVSVLFGVLTRSSGVATLAALGVWFISSSVVDARHLLNTRFGDEVAAWIKNAVEVAYTVLPKIKDLETLNVLALSRAHMSGAARLRTFGQIPEIDWWFAGGTTAAFTVVMLGLAVWIFRRRDY